MALWVHWKVKAEIRTRSQTNSTHSLKYFAFDVHLYIWYRFVHLYIWWTFVHLSVFEQFPTWANVCKRVKEGAQRNTSRTFILKWQTWRLFIKLARSFVSSLADSDTRFWHGKVEDIDTPCIEVHKVKRLETKMGKDGGLTHFGLPEYWHSLWGKLQTALRRRCDPKRRSWHSKLPFWQKRDETVGASWGEPHAKASSVFAIRERRCWEALRNGERWALLVRGSEKSIGMVVGKGRHRIRTHHNKCNSVSQKTWRRKKISSCTHWWGVYTLQPPRRPYIQ